MSVSPSPTTFIFSNSTADRIDDMLKDYPDMLRVGDLARLLNCATQTIRNRVWRRNADLPDYIEIQGIRGRRFPKAAVAVWLAANWHQCEFHRAA